MSKPATHHHPTMATTRLRKTFKYPSDSDSDASNPSHDGLDEEEQETLIARLRARETSSNETYTLIFSAIPLVIALLFVYYLFSTFQTRLTALLCLLSITSLVCSAFTMRFVPVNVNGTLDSSLAGQKARLRASASASSFAAADGPLVMILPYLNGAIAALLCLAAWRLRTRESSPEGQWLFLLLPAVVFGMVTVARRSMADVDRGIGELSKLRYDYKGA